MEITETRKLYYEDPHMRSFRATVTGCTEGAQGWEITLDATAFYPEGGGQAADIGTLGLCVVKDVQERNGNIFHLCDRPLEVGQTVEGNIDWAHRFDLMQQHSGEHIISGLLYEKFGYMNTGFHVGADVMEVDFDGPVSMADLLEIEAKANEAVFRDLPVKCWIPTPEELPGVFYRTKRPLSWPVRIVQIPYYDSCACCGIHVKHTGEIGLIKILSCTALRGGVRLEMVCGGRAYRHIAAVFEENRQVSQAFSAPMNATGEAARKVNEALSAEKIRSAGLTQRLLTMIAGRYKGETNVLHFEPDLNSGDLRLLAEKLTQVICATALVFSGKEGNYNYCLASQKEDLRPLNRRMNEALSGRGGGKPHFQQGIVHATAMQIRSFFEGENLV